MGASLSMCTCGRGDQSTMHVLFHSLVLVLEQGDFAASWQNGIYNSEPTGSTHQSLN